MNKTKAHVSETFDEEMETDSEEDFAVSHEARRDDLDSNNQATLRQPWILVSLLFIVAAAVLLLLSHTDAAFVAIALGVSAWFWNMRLRLKSQYGKHSRWR